MILDRFPPLMLLSIVFDPISTILFLIDFSSFCHSLTLNICFFLFEYSIYRSLFIYIQARICIFMHDLQINLVGKLYHIVRIGSRWQLLILQECNFFLYYSLRSLFLLNRCSIFVFCYYFCWEEEIGAVLSYSLCVIFWVKSLIFWEKGVE